jgi:transposase
MAGMAWNTHQGALAYVYRMKEPRTSKDRWLIDLIERAGPRRAAVALANKNVRTAWALVTQGTEYQRREQQEMAA